MARRHIRRKPSSKRSAPNSLLTRFGNLRQYISNPLVFRKGKTVRRTVTLARRHPFASFFILLGLLFLLIVLNSILTPKPKEIISKPVIKEVETYKVGSVPRIVVSAQVQKDGIVKIVAQSPGIISNINVVDGQTVWRGENLLSLSNNYQGGNTASVQRELAAAQYENIKNTYDAQKQLIGKQRELASKGDENADEVRLIADKSLSETRSIISLNENIISTLETNLSQLEAGNIGGVNDAAILATKQQLSQMKSANSQLNQGLRSAEFQASGDKLPAGLSNLQKDVTSKQLDLQEKALDLQLESSRLQLQLSQIMEGAMFPAAPSEGVVERVHVVTNQSVNPGTVLITLSGADKNTTAVARLPADIAKKISRLEESILTVDNKRYSVFPEYISEEATDGLLNTVVYALPEESHKNVSQQDYIKVEIPMGYPNTIKSIPYVPIDIVFQTQDGAFLYVLKNNEADVRNVDLGTVLGSFVEIRKGLNDGDQIILDRNVIDGEEIKVKK